MKKMTFFALAAVMFASAVVLTGCKNDENEPEKKNEVAKTEFSIALPDQVSGARRMPGATVQKEGRSQFQGMTNITLVPFVHQRAITAADTRLGNNIELGDIAAASELGTNSNAKVYDNVSIPLTTASFLFYAQSKKTGTNFEKGVLTQANLTAATPADFEFNLQPIVSNLATAQGDAKAEALLYYLNSIARASDGTKNWEDYLPADDAGMAAMFETFSTTHVLSSAGVERIVYDLYNSLVPLNSTLATKIKEAIETGADIGSVGGDGKYPVTLKSSLAGYPENINLPDGAIHVKYDATTSPKAFRFFSDSEYESHNFAKLNLFTYPSSLWYYVNSKIKTSNQSQKDKYNNTNDWAAILGYHTSSRAVNSLTRAVAIEDQIQYGVARLDVQVKLDGTVLEDNAADPKNVSCSSYPITGILVGGQRNVGFDFVPNGTNVYTIYDNVMTSPSMAAGADYSAMNSTLVLETEGGTESTKDVIMAVEFTNASGVDFNGVDGCLIPAGSKFYVLARLAASAATETSNKVFKQDYTTTVRLNLLNLKTAYNTIPDLRTPQLELGFSVNLEWQAGHTYTIDFL